MRFDDGYETEDRCVHKISAAEGCPRCDGPRDEEPLVVLCAWHPNAGHLTSVLAACGVYASHGICSDHDAQLFPDEEEPRAAA
jgi:hypothetical protein